VRFGASEQWQVYDEEGRRKYVSDGERSRFLAAAKALEPRLSALCHVLAFTGCRVSEALALKRCHLDPERGALVFRTLKRRRLAFRVVPIPPELAAMVAALPMTENERFWSMHRTTAWRAVKEVMDAARIEGPMACPKGLRHGFGIRAAGCAIPASLIQRWMGHASAATTAIYTDAVGIEERQIAERMWRR